MTTLSRPFQHALGPLVLCALGLSSAVTACGGSQTPPGDAGLADCDQDFPPDEEINFDLRTGRLHGSVTLSGSPLPSSSNDRGAVILYQPGDMTYGLLNLGTDAPATMDIPLEAGTYQVLYVRPTCSSGSTDPLCAAHEPDTTITIRADEVTLTDIDLRPRHLPITLTLGGQPLREATLGPRGTLWFARDTGQTTVLTVPGTGPATVDADLYPGTYHVRWTADPTSCGPGLPCADGDVTDALVVDGSGTPVTLDVSTVPLPVRLGGTITVNGAPMGDGSSSRGSLQFLSPWGAVATIDVGATGPAQYSTTLPIGTYDLVWLGVPESCGGAQLPPAPCLTQTIRTGVAVTTGGVLDVDLHAVTVTGTVTLNGAPPPDVTGTSRGAIGLANDSQTTAFPLPATGPATYSFLLLPGSYQARWIPSGVPCTALSGTGMPCNSGMIRTEVSVGEAPARYDLDVAAARVRGNLLFNGAPPATPPGGAPSITFSHVDSPYGPLLGVTPDTTHTPAFDVLLLAGTYLVGWSPDRTTCMATASPECLDGPVLRNVRLDGDTALDVNVRSTRLHGALTVNSAPLPDTSRDRGVIWFGNYNEVQLGTTGPGTFDVTVLSTPGNFYYSVGVDCTVGAPADVPLCGGTQLFGCTGP